MKTSPLWSSTTARDRDERVNKHITIPS